MPLPIYVAGSYWKPMPKWHANVFYSNKTGWCVYKGLMSCWFCLNGEAEKRTRPFGPYKTREEAMGWTVFLQEIECVFGKGALENQRGTTSSCQKNNTVTIQKLASLLES